VFNGSLEKLSGFIIVYKLYIRMKMREEAVKEQIQWILLYVQGGLADVWKENVLEDLEARVLEYEIAEEFLTDTKKEFEGGNKKIVKVVEFKKLEQGGKMMEKFIQKFRRVARGSEYEGKLLIEEFKRGMNGTIY